MNVPDTILERIVRVEERQKNMEQDVHAMSVKVDEMHTLLMQAKGARWAIIAMASVGGFIAGIAAKFAPIFR